MGRKIGRHVKEARENASMSQAELAEKLGLKSAQSISNIERGIAPLPRALMRKLADLLKLNRTELVDIALEEMREKYMDAVGSSKPGVDVDAASELAEDEN